MFKLFDVVTLVSPVREHRINPGELGAIVDIYTEPTLAYEVEFVTRDGEERAMIPLLPEQIRLATPHEVEQASRND